MTDEGRLCALILIHHSPELAARLIARLEGFGIACFVHVDAKVDIGPFQRACSSETAQFVPNRVDIRWGGFSAVSATLQLIAAALVQSDASHFLLISGDTYPLCGRQAFLDHFITAPSRIEIREVAPQEPVYQRIARTYLPDTRLGQFRLSEESSLGRYLTSDHVANFATISEAFAMKQADFPWRFAKGSQWWCLTRPAVEQCLSVIRRERDFVTWFRYSSIPDESFIHSIYLNFLSEPFINHPPVFTVWNKTPRPYIFRESKDLHLLQSCRTVLARKFSADQLSLLDELDAEGRNR